MNLCANILGNRETIGSTLHEWLGLSFERVVCNKICVLLMVEITAPSSWVARPRPKSWQNTVQRCEPGKRRPGTQTTTRRWDSPVKNTLWADDRALTLISIQIYLPNIQVCLTLCGGVGEDITGIIGKAKKDRKHSEQDNPIEEFGHCSHVGPLASREAEEGETYTGRPNPLPVQRLNCGE